MHGLSQNATRSLTDRWGLKQWGAIQTRNGGGRVVCVCMCVCDSFLAAYVPTAISSFPTVCMDLGGWPVGQAPSITNSQPIMLTDSSVESAPGF